MPAGPIVYLLCLALVSAILVGLGYRRDRVLGVILLISLAMRFTGSILFGLYLDSQGREFFADDEMGYVRAGELILAEWESNVTYELPYQEHAIYGSYSFWNAFLIWMWGPSLLPMRFANGVVGTTGAFIAYLLAQRLFADSRASRWAALLVAFSPSLVIWSLTNLKETFIGVSAAATVLAGFLSLSRLGWRNVVMFLASLLVLGSVRRYYAVILSWLTILVYLLYPKMRFRFKMIGLLSLTISTSLALLLLTGSLMGAGLTTETLGRYIVTEGYADAEVEYLEFPPDPVQLLSNLPSVLFGRFDSRAGVGQLMSLLLFPEWLATFLLIPLACWGLVTAVKRGRYEALLPAGFICVMMLVLAWIHGDIWTTYRFRASYWPLLLVLAAGGASVAFSAIRVSRPTSRGSTVYAPANN
jgi:hypothetical protein